IPILMESGLKDEQLWISGAVDSLHNMGLHAFISEFTHSIRQCEVDFLGPLIMTSPNEAKKCLHTFSRWGINRFSVGYGSKNSTNMARTIRQWGFDVNINTAPDFESFLKALILLPKSITSSFTIENQHVNTCMYDTDDLCDKRRKIA
ncbi:MAG: hypothetical protein JXM72_11535, partial [Deltaproteobacteria bacterium]|nr:hypothetical protein [Deltaproteobacteria bacterium]